MRFDFSLQAILELKRQGTMTPEQKRVCFDTFESIIRTTPLSSGGDGAIFPTV
jgi:hypothetical protein